MLGAGRWWDMQIFLEKFGKFSKKKMPISKKKRPKFFFGIFINKIGRNLRKIAIFGIFSPKRPFFLGKSFILCRKFFPGFSRFLPGRGTLVNQDLARGGTIFWSPGGEIPPSPTC